MGRKRTENAEALTEEEVAFLRSDRTPDLIRQFTARQHDALGVRTSAYRKVAAAARAEYEALMAVAAVNVARHRAGVLPESTGQSAASRVLELESELAVVREKQGAERLAQHVLSAGAQAVSGD